MSKNKNVLKKAGIVAATGFLGLNLWYGIQDFDKLKNTYGSLFTSTSTQIEQSEARTAKEMQETIADLESRLKTQNETEAKEAKEYIDTTKTDILKKTKEYNDNQVQENIANQSILLEAIKKSNTDVKTSIKKVEEKLEDTVENLKSDISDLKKQKVEYQKQGFKFIEGTIINEKGTEVINNSQNNLYAMARDSKGKIITDVNGFPLIYWTKNSKKQISRNNIRNSGQIAAGRNLVPADYGVVGMWKATLGGKHRFTYINKDTKQLETKLFEDDTYMTQAFGSLGSLVRTPTLGLKELSNKYVENAIDHGPYKWTVGLLSRIITNVADGIIEPFSHTEMEMANASTSLVGDATGKYLIVQINDEGQYAFNSIDFSKEGSIEDKALQLGGATVREGVKAFIIYSIAGGFGGGSSGGNSSGSSSGNGGSSSGQAYGGWTGSGKL